MNILPTLTEIVHRSPSGEVSTYQGIVLNADYDLVILDLVSESFLITFSRDTILEMRDLGPLTSDEPVSEEDREGDPDEA